MPFYCVGCDVPIQLRAHVDEVLHGGDVDDVHRGEVQDHRAEYGPRVGGSHGRGLGRGVVPGPVSRIEDCCGCVRPGGGEDVLH